MKKELFLLLSVILISMSNSCQREEFKPVEEQITFELISVLNDEKLLDILAQNMDDMKSFSIYA